MRPRCDKAATKNLTAGIAGTAENSLILGITHLCGEQLPRKLVGTLQPRLEFAITLGRILQTRIEMPTMCGHLFPLRDAGTLNVGRTLDRQNERVLPRCGY